MSRRFFLNTITALITFTVLALMFSAAAHAQAATVVVPQLSCAAGTGSSAPTSYQLLKKATADAAYVLVTENPTCSFSNVAIPDNTETCFHFVAKNTAGQTERKEVSICYDPRLLPLLPPTSVGIK